jgi:hypothetical protein
MKHIKLPNNPFEHRDKIQQVEKLKQRELTTEERIKAVLEGDKPTDVMSWEYFIWNRYKDPLNRGR